MPNMSDIAIVPSVLPADFSRLGAELEALEAAGADRIQWDVMDGNFVPNITVGPDVIANSRKATSLPFEAHLMIYEPEPTLGRYIDAGCEMVIVHAEACRHLHRTLAHIRELGAKSGVALNPSSPIELISHVLDLTDQVLIMTVNPGFGGQSYIASMEPKIARMREIISTLDRDIPIEVDGGIGMRTAPGAAAAGARLLVAGSALFQHPGGLKEAVSELRDAAQAARA